MLGAPICHRLRNKRIVVLWITSTYLVTLAEAGYIGCAVLPVLIPVIGVAEGVGVHGGVQPECWEEGKGAGTDEKWRYTQTW
jgi:hypothetical protein